MNLCVYFGKIKAMIFLSHSLQFWKCFTINIWSEKLIRFFVFFLINKIEWLNSNESCVFFWMFVCALDIFTIFAIFIRTRVESFRTYSEACWFSSPYAVSNKKPIGSYRWHFFIWNKSYHRGKICHYWLIKKETAVLLVCTLTGHGY